MPSSNVATVRDISDGDVSPWLSRFASSTTIRYDEWLSEL
jgi:hypothetical protein